MSRDRKLSPEDEALAAAVAEQLDQTWRCTCGSRSDEQHTADCREFLKSLARATPPGSPRDLATHWRREAERLKVRNDELEARNGELEERDLARREDELPDLMDELHRLDAFVRAYRAMSGDAERRRALHYLQDRFPPPSVMRDGPPGGTIVRGQHA